MTSWPILSLTTFLPLVGALFIMMMRGEDDTVKRNARWVALWATLITFAVSLLNYAFKLLPTGVEEPVAEVADSRFELLTAIYKGDQARVYELLNMEVKINFYEQGFTPLHLAVERGYPDIVRMLVNSGADIEAQNAEGKTPVEVALDKKFIRSSEILFKAAKFYAAKAENKDKAGEPKAV